MPTDGAAPDRLPHDGEVDGLTVQIPRAKRLLPMDKAKRGEQVGSSDPYARLVYDDSEGKRQSVRTHTIDKTLRPQWIERPDTCTFVLSVKRGAEIELTVWDQDALTDDLIGGAHISTANCFVKPGAMWSGWVELFTQVGRKTFLPGSKTSLGKKAGEVFITLQWSGIPEKRFAHLAAGGLLSEADTATTGAEKDDGPVLLEAEAFPDEDTAPAPSMISSALFTANAVRGMNRTKRRVKTPPVRPVLGRGMAARLGIAYGVTEQLRRDFDQHLLPPGQCAAPLREVIWSLLRYVLAGADADTLDAQGLMRFIADGASDEATWDDQLPPPPRTDGEPTVRDALRDLPMTWQERRKMKKAQHKARIAAGKERAACLSAVEEERKQRRWWLLSPLAVGMLAELAFDVAVESVPLQEFFAVLHALLSACVALGAHVVAAELEADGRTSHLVDKWGLKCPAPHCLATLGGVVGILRLRGAGIMAAAAGPGAGSNARIKAAERREKLANKTPAKRLVGTGGEPLALRPVPLSQRVWARKLEMTMDTPSCGSEPPRPSLSVEAWAEAAPDVHAAAAAVHNLAGGLPVPRLQWPPVANAIYERLVEAVEFGGGGMGLGWQAVRLTTGVHPSVRYGYMATPCFSACKHCRLELLEMELAKVSGLEGFGRDRPPHHRTAEGIAVCHKDGMTYTFRLPQQLAVSWCIQAALHVRDVALYPVLDARAPTGAFLFEDEPSQMRTQHQAHQQAEEREEENIEDPPRNDTNEVCGAGLLTVRLIQARNLKKMDMVGGADPFVIFTCGHEPEQKSKIVKQNRNPRWEATFEFPCSSSFVTLDVHVLDWDRLGTNDSMGRVSLSTSDMDGTVRWYPLAPTTDCSEPEGDIQLECTAEFPDLRPSQTAETDATPLPGADYGDMAWTTHFCPYVGESGLVPLGHGALCRVPEGSQAPTVTVGLKESLLTAAAPYPTPVEKQALQKLQTKAERAARDNRGVRVRVHIVAARGLKKMDRFGKADPFVTVNLGGTAALRAAAEMPKAEVAGWKQAKTAVVRNSLAPRWNEACEMTFPTQIATSSDCRVELTMYDWDAVGANDPMGRVILPLADITSGKYELGQGGRKPPDPKLKSELDSQEQSPDNHAAKGKTTQEQQNTPTETTPQRGQHDTYLEHKAEAGTTEPGDHCHGIPDAEGLWLPLRPLNDAGDDDDNQRNELLVTIYRASGLKVMDKNLFGKGGSSDPFVEVKCGGERAKSSIKKKTLTPDWRGEVVSIRILEGADVESEVVLTVWDWDRVGANDFMGRTSVTLGELLAAANAEEDGSDDSDVEVDQEVGDDWATPEEQDQMMAKSREGGGGGRRRKAVLMNKDGMEDEGDSLGQITYSIRWVRNAEIAAERQRQLADVQGEVLIRAEAERLPQTAAEAASEHKFFLKLLDTQGPQWPIGAPIVCTLPPPVTTNVEVAVRYVTKSGTAMGGVGYLEKEETLFFSLGPQRPTQSICATPKLLHDPLRFEKDFDAKGDEHFFVRITAAKLLSVKAGTFAEHPKLQISDARRTSTVVIDSGASHNPEGRQASAPSASLRGPAEPNEDPGLKAARDASTSWVPFVGGEFTCSRCGRVARKHLDGVVWPECVAEHGPPFVYVRRPRVDVLHSSALAPLEVRRHQMAWLSRPVLALHREGKAARRRARRLGRVAHEARQQGRRSIAVASRKAQKHRADARGATDVQQCAIGWDNSPAGVVRESPGYSKAPRNHTERSKHKRKQLVHIAHNVPRAVPLAGATSLPAL